MTDTERAEIIAKDVMKWKIWDEIGFIEHQFSADFPCVVKDDDGLLWLQLSNDDSGQLYDPATRSEHCMAAWFELGKHRHVHLQIGYSEKHDKQYCEAWFGDKEGYARFCGDTDPLKAMCKCLVKAVERGMMEES